MVYTNIIFDEAKDIFCRLMDRWGLSDQHILDTLNYYDIENVSKCGGYAKECFPNALIETYLHYCKAAGKVKCLQKVEQLRELGLKVLYRPPLLMEGVHHVLEKIAVSYELFLITKGDQEIQRKRVSQSGLENYFRKIYVVPDKERRVFKEIIQDYGISAGKSWSVGNSIKADINPALQAGLNCVHVQTPSWDFEHADPEGDFFTVRNIQDVVNVILGNGPEF